MSSLIALFSIVILYGREVYCDDITKTLKPENTMILKKNDSHPLQKETLWSSLLSKRLESMNIKNTEKHENNKINTMEMFNKRKSKFLGSLAFLAGLGFGGLAGAASSTVKAYAKFPQAAIAMNFVPSKQGPYLAAYYDPYPFVPHPYLYHAPLGFYPFMDPLKLQSLIGGSSQQNGADRPDQIITVFDDKRPSDSDDSEEEYIVEKKKIDKSKKPSSRLENRVGSAESLIGSVDRRTEGEMTNQIVTCETQKKFEEEVDNVSTKDSMMYDFEDLQEDADNSRASTNRRKTQANNSTTSRPDSNFTTRRDHTPRPTHTPASTPTTTNLTVENSTMENNTTFSPFFGYYDGNPQNIENIDLTSDMLPPIYQEPNPINYHLPYERPANFYSDERYNFYSNSFPNSYPSGPFFSEHLSDYSTNDFDRYVYPSDNNSPTYVNQFKPINPRRPIGRLAAAPNEETCFIFGRVWRAGLLVYFEKAAAATVLGWGTTEERQLWGSWQRVPQTYGVSFLDDDDDDYDNENDDNDEEDATIS
ncbi:hypothetical protein HZH68_008077 [Vespula germanica]|uniref:Uncharacterized protein n=1 Tax=Vespula germanica TaxID=30212 RepID=A0A834N8A9_VESGE|nr:hypothetical protein HZH68_008077 [Vespula germanica]